MSNDNTADTRCPLTKVARIIYGKDGTPRVAPILSSRNKENDKGIVYKFGKKAGRLKPNKHRDCNET